MSPPAWATGAHFWNFLEQSYIFEILIFLNIKMKKRRFPHGWRWILLKPPHVVAHSTRSFLLPRCNSIWVIWGFYSRILQHNIWVLKIAYFSRNKKKVYTNTYIILTPIILMHFSNPVFQAGRGSILPLMRHMNDEITYLVSQRRPTSASNFFLTNQARELPIILKSGWTQTI